MSTLRLILAAFISAGLILAPAQPVRLTSSDFIASTADAIMTAGPSTNQDCTCCNLAARCAMATCAIHCVQFAPTSAVPKNIVIVGHAAFAGLLPLLHEGLDWQPPAPPPRV